MLCYHLTYFWDIALPTERVPGSRGLMLPTGHDSLYEAVQRLSCFENAQLQQCRNMLVLLHRLSLPGG